MSFDSGQKINKVNTVVSWTLWVITPATIDAIDTMLKLDIQNL